jgi:5-methylcytosine-specific restriction enzyme subunit McrC
VDKNIILDTKWKIINDIKDISQSDLYQMFAYAMRYNCDEVYLIYPKINDIKTDSFDFIEMDKKLHIRFFDLQNFNIDL